MNNQCGEIYDYLFKILIIGDSGVGKTCLLLSYTKENYNTSYLATVGIDFALKMISSLGKFIKLQIWDTAGQERYKTITNNYYNGSDGILIVYDVNNRVSFDNVVNWIRNTEEKAKSSVVKVLIGNKIDKNGREVEFNEASTLAAKHNMLFFETSTKHTKKVISIFNYVAEKILSLKISEKKETRRDSISIRNNQKFDMNKGYCCTLL